MDDETCNGLLATNKYWYEVSAVSTQTIVHNTTFNITLVQTGEANTGRPFLNATIIDILKEEYFDSKKSLYKLYPQEFKPTLVAKNGGKGLEMPPRLVALVATFVRSTAVLCIQC